MVQDTLPVSSHRQHSLYVEDIAKRMYPLPIFNGNPDDWPLFMVSYNDTTQEFGYNHRQNLLRLQKALQGEAKQVVASLLLYPDNVPQVIEELKFNFGRPEILIRSQLLQLQQIPAIAENNPDGVISLSNKVRNIVALFKAANCKEQLMNPMLLEQLLDKLPRSKQFEWAKHAATIKSHATLEDFSTWISNLARIVCFMPVAAKPRQGVSSSNVRAQTYTQSKRMLHTAFANNTNKGCRCCKGTHQVHECAQFKSRDVNTKWENVKKHRLCISGLKPGHQVINCRNKKLCNINGCRRMHDNQLSIAGIDNSAREIFKKLDIRA